MQRLITSLLVIALMTTTVLAERKWLTGKLVNVRQAGAAPTIPIPNVGYPNRVAGALPGIIQSAVRDRSQKYQYTIYTDDRFYIGEKTVYATTTPTEPTRLDLNGPVKFVIVGISVIILDRDGKEQTLTILQQGLLPESK